VNGTHLPPQLLALDVDGTLVEPRKPIRPAVVAAVRRSIAAGVKTTIVTGRMFVAAKPLVETLGIQVPIICYQGAVIANSQTGRFEREVSMPNAVALRIYQVAKEHGLHVQFYRDDRFYVEQNNEYAQLYAKTSSSEPIVVPSLPEAFAGHDSTKVNIVAKPEKTPEIYELMLRTCGDDAYVTRSNPEFVEMMNPQVDKGVALRILAEKLGVPMDRVMAIGDSYNDLPLLETAGFAVAMGSAPPEVKAQADATTGDVLEDGVAQAIDRYVFGEVARTGA